MDTHFIQKGQRLVDVLQAMYPHLTLGWVWLTDTHIHTHAILCTYYTDTAIYTVLITTVISQNQRLSLAHDVT